MRYRKIASHVLPTGYPMRLTKANVAKLSLPEGKSELLVFDEALAGFGIRLRYGGKRTWIAQYRVGSKQRRMSLGSTETLDAEEARRRARSALSKVNLGTDPQIEKANARIKASVTIGATVENLLGATRGTSQAEITGRRAPLSSGPLGAAARGRRAFRHAFDGRGAARGDRDRQRPIRRESRPSSPVGFLLVGDRRGAGQRKPRRRHE